jgi:starch synthase
MENRVANRRSLQQRAGLPIRDDVPIVAMVTRIDHQKGFDITGHVLHRLMNNDAGEAQFILLGSGDHRSENMLRGIADYHREKMKLFLGYDPELAPLIYGGSDIFLMPSLFEPCGLGQLIAMRYGSVPVVREVGGLTDTVREPVTGFGFVGYNSDEFWNALARALYVYRNHPDQWREIQHNGMTADFTWQTSAERYCELYHWAISRMRGY